MAQSYIVLASILESLAGQVISSKQFAALVRAEAIGFESAIGSSPAFFASASATELVKKPGTGNAPIVFLPTATGYKVLAASEQHWPESKGRGKGAGQSDAALLVEVQQLRAQLAAKQTETV